MEAIWAILRVAFYGTALLPLLVVGWVLFEARLRPCLIDRAEIERLAEAIMRRRPDDPEHAAFAEEHAAWLRSEMFEQGKWRRVRGLIRSRFARGEGSLRSRRH